MSSEKRSLASGRPKSKLRYTIRGGFDFDAMGHSRYHELRKLVKKGNDFCKELGNIMQERVELESYYAKTMSKLSAKLIKVAQKGVGSIQNAWLAIGKEMDADGQAHRSTANSLEEDVVKPLKNLQETHCRVKKAVECSVSKTKKCMSKWRSEERRSRKESFAVARENEKVQDMAAADASYSILTSNANLNKDAAKLENKKRKLEESVKKSYAEYYTYCVRTARAKLEWEMSVNSGEKNFMTLEEERLLRLKEYAQHVLHSYQKFVPKISQVSSRLSEPIYECDVSKDYAAVTKTVDRYDEDLSLQILPDFYPEHTNLAMNKNRRITALTKILQLVRQDLERERRSKEGLDTLANAMLRSSDPKHDDSNNKNISEKLRHTNLMIIYLEAIKYKVVTALDTLEGQTPSVSNALARHIETTRDKNGHQMSVLKMPVAVYQKLTSSSADPASAHGAMWSDRGSADGTDIDDFSSDEDDDGAAADENSGPRCKALYHYSAKLNDELNLEPGDVIHVHSKKSDGWWLGELNGATGVFPATYVVEID